MPARVQRKRTKGWRLPVGAVCVTRPGRWGNPHKPGPFGKHPTAFECVAFFRQWAEKRATEEPDWLAPLRGKDLACFCALDQPCHADVLLELANR